MRSVAAKVQTTTIPSAPERAIAIRPRRPLIEADLSLIRLPARYHSSEFERINDGFHKRCVDQYRHKIVKAMARGYGLMFWGDNGRGKTSCAAILAMEARRHDFTVLFIRASDLLKADREREWFDEYHSETVVERAQKVDLLVIDDLGKESDVSTGYMAGRAQDLFEDIIRTRASQLLATIVTTNLTPSQMGRSGEDGERYKKSTFSVLKSCLFPVEVTGHDFRQDESKEVRSIFTDEPASR